ncbi:MAG TPA: hypothetical protein VGF73_13050 [Chthoniobacterales bacterium]
MSLRKRLAFFLILVLVAGALDALLAPFVVAHGVRFWLEWTAKKEGLSAEIGKVDAPFLRPVAIHQVRIVPVGGKGVQLNLEAETVVADLNLGGWIFGRGTALLRSVEVERLVASLRPPEHPAAIRELDWRKFAQLLPDNFHIGNADLDFESAAASASLRGLMVNGSAIESGKFFAREISFASPVLRQTFHNLRGATSWEGSRLTIAGIPLVRGLDLEALTLDLSHLAKRRLGVDLQLDTFGGTLRASFDGRAREKFVVDVAGSASNISLAQISQALGFLEPVTGAVRASKFTFRGNPGQFLDATASVWMELTDFSWRARHADSVMLGATYYDRRLEVDQLYVRQRQNELTINGELHWPKKLSSWTQLPFRGQITATIPDLNGFAQFFGATTGAFSGALLANGQIDLLTTERHGRVALHGREVKIRGVALDSLGATLELQGAEVKVDSLEARHGDDFLRGEGTVELAAPHRFSGRLTGAINDLGSYAPFLPAEWRASPLGGGATFDWRGDGTLAAHSGTMQVFAHGLQLPVAPLRTPLDLTLEGSYSPQDIFFRTFKVANDRVSLGGFLTLGNNFAELQAIQLTLDGKPRVSGTLFLPISMNQWRLTHRLLAALDETQKFDVDLLVQQLDLGGLVHALGESSSLTGVLDGKLAAFGTLPSLQVTTALQLSNVGAFRSSNTIALDGHLAGGRAEVETSATFGVSEPIRVRTSLGLRLTKSRFTEGTVVDPAAPFFLDVDCPALFLKELPNEVRFGAEDGFLTGRIAFSSTLAAPTISGEADIVAARFRPGPPWSEVNGLTARIQFSNHEARIDALRCEIDSRLTNWYGRLTATPENFSLTISPRDEIAVVSQPLIGADLATIRLVGEAADETSSRLLEAGLRGRIGGPASLTTKTEDPATGLTRRTTMFIKSSTAGGSPLLLRILPPTPPEYFQLEDAARARRSSDRRSRWP